jgi:hypothetical protein
VEEYQWAWRGALILRLEALIPETVLRAWRDADPLCHEWSWYNALDTFAAARAKQLGLRPRPPKRTVCSCCSREFLESQLPHTSIARVGVNGINVCDRCLAEALYAKGSLAATPEAVIAVLQTLSSALQRPPKGSDLNGRLDLKGLSGDARATVVQALRIKPTVARVKDLFGSWDAAVAHAAGAPLTALPPYEPRAVVLPAADTAFTSNDPARYRSATGPLPEIMLDPGRDVWAYREEVESLIGTGCLALAEAALLKLTVQDHLLHQLLAQVYGQTARFDEARNAMKQAFGEGQEEPLASYLLRPRDLRTITAGPAFYEPLPSLPRGNVRFVLVGGPMEYVDRRGEHRCTTGDPPEGGAAAERAESVTRVNAMVDGASWMQAAAEAGQAIMTSLVRAGADPRPYGHLVSYVTSHLRDVVKSVTGALPKKVAEDAWCLGPVGKSGWSYQRDAGHYIFNASAGFAFMTVEAAPAVCIWGWPDRSDLCLQAFLDTVAAGTPEPVTVILPDVPAFRSFARRYSRKERMEKARRTLMEEYLYRTGSMINKRGYVLSAEFAPRLIVHPDGTEEDGSVLGSAMAYLDAHHTLRLSVWDILSDPLLREAAIAAPVAKKPFSASVSDRVDMVRWYSQMLEFDDVGALLSAYRPSLLDAGILA